LLKKIVYRIVSVLLLSIAVLVLNLRLIEANRITSIGPRRLANLHADSPSVDVGPCQSYIFVTILDVNASHIKAFPGATINICVLFEVTWDVFDFDGFSVEAFYDGHLIDHKGCIVLWSGHAIEHVNFAWNTSGVEIGSHSIWARAIATNVHIYADGHIQILPVGNLNTGEGYSTIQEAINAANSGDTIFVKNGTYSAAVINKTLILEGENKYGTVIEGGIEPYGAGLWVLANNVGIARFTIQHGRGPPIRVEDGYVNTTISDNIMTGFSEGIRLIHTSGNVIVNNIIRDSFGGIGFDWSSNNFVHNNTLAHLTLGIMGGYPSYNNTFSENTIIGCSCGIEMNYIFSGNRFLHNNFINNTVQINFYGPVIVNSWNNTCEGNYWSDYIGTDSDNDGIGDTPYVIDSNNIDHCPLMNHFWNPADINHDLKVNLKDVYTTGKAYGSAPGDAKWNPHCDINADAIIDLKDYYAVCKSFGQSYNGS